MIVRLGRSPNAIVRGAGPVIVASTIRHTPWMDPRVDCAPIPSLATSPALNAIHSNLFTIPLLYSVRRDYCRWLRAIEIRFAPGAIALGSVNLAAPAR